MKLKYLIGSMLIALTIGTFFTSCEKDDGSLGIEMKMRNEGYDQLAMLYVDSAYYYDYWHSGHVVLKISGSNNFYLYGYNNNSDCDIVCVGNVRGLSRINNIPQYGWAKQVAVQPGQGYIIRSKNPSGSEYSQWCKYARVYVVEWIEGVSGGIIGATIRYQDNWIEE